MSDLPGFISLDIRPNLEAAPWDDLPAPAGHGIIERIGLLPNGTNSGRPVLAMVIRLGDGQHVIAQTTWALISSTIRALAGSPVAELDRREHG